MSNEKQIMRSTFKNGRTKFGMLKDSSNIFYVEDFVQMIALDVVESYGAINSEEKKREETNIDLQMQVLDSLSNALKSLETISYY